MYRVLSMDGGPAGSTYIRFLRTIEEQRPGFLASADLFAGVSDGATFASYFANVPREKRDLALIEDAIDFNGQLLEAMEPDNFLNYLRLFTGFFSAKNGRGIQQLLYDHFGRRTTLGDLYAPVVLVSFRMERPWGVKVFNNIRLQEPDLDESVADAIDKSASFPVIVPVRDGHCDGGIFCNTPSMTALAEILHDRDVIEEVDDAGDVIMMSLGGDPKRIGSRLTQRGYQQAFLEWGWIPWLLNPTAPLLALEALVSAGDRGASFQTRQFLEDRFFRLAGESVTVVEGLIDVFLGRGDELIEEAEKRAHQWSTHPDSPQFTPNLDQTLEWIDRVWFGGESDAEVETPHEPEAETPVVPAPGAPAHA